MGRQYEDAAVKAAALTQQENARWATTHWNLQSEHAARAAALRRAADNAATTEDAAALYELSEDADGSAANHGERAQAHANAARRADHDDQRARDEARTTLRTLETWAELTCRDEAATALRAVADALDGEDAQHTSQQ